MKAAFVVVVVLALFSSSFALTLSPIVAAPQLDLCPTCVSFSSQAIDQLLNIIVNLGIVGSCDAVCSYLPNKIESSVCNLLCDIVGIEEFIKVVQEADLDPIYFCQLLHVCAIHDDAEAMINNATVTPATGRQGTTFVIEMDFTVENETGAGEYAVSIFPPDGEPFGDAELTPGLKPGRYAVRFELKAQPSEQEAFNAGLYKVELAICNGECGSKHPHSKIFDVKNTQFTIEN